MTYGLRSGAPPRDGSEGSSLAAEGAGGSRGCRREPALSAPATAPTLARLPPPSPHGWMHRRGSRAALLLLWVPRCDQLCLEKKVSGNVKPPSHFPNLPPAPNHSLFVPQFPLHAMGSCCPALLPQMLRHSGRSQPLAHADLMADLRAPGRGCPWSSSGGETEARSRAGTCLGCL